MIILGSAYFMRHPYLSPIGLTHLFIIIQLVDSNIHHVFDWLICLLPGNLIERKSKVTR